MFLQFKDNSTYSAQRYMYKEENKVLVSQQLDFIHTNIHRDIIAFIDITVMIIMSVNTSFIIRFRTAEWEVKEREVNKTGEVNTALIITTNKQTNSRVRLELGWRTRPSIQTFLSFI